MFTEFIANELKPVSPLHFFGQRNRPVLAKTKSRDKTVH